MIAQALAQPIQDLIDQSGTGRLGATGQDAALRCSCRGIDSALQSGALTEGGVSAGWQGIDAEAAVRTATAAAAAGAALVRQGDGIAAVLGEAAAGVERGVGELGGILQSFLAIVAGEGPALLTPAGQVAVVAAAAGHLEQALAVVARMRGELDAHAAAMAQYLPEVPLPAVPAGLAGGAADALAGAGGQAADGLHRLAADAWGEVKGQVDALLGVDGTGAGGATIGGDAADGGGDDGASCPPGCTCPACAADGPGGVAPAAGDAAAAAAGYTGDGVAVTLPDGDVVTAPNERAADAVRAALTQRGVPYSWGGTTPGEGLDCSGLTQWAYGQAGVDLPRLAQEQTVGMPVAADSIAAGDLAVWDGHVAMVLGDGRMIEAGDPVAISPVRTANGDMAFRGFYRPTAA